MNRAVKRLFVFGTETIIAGIVFPTCLAIGYRLLTNCGSIHALTDSKQGAIKQVSWYADLIWLGAGLVSIGFVSLIFVVLSIVISLARKETRLGYDEVAAVRNHCKAE